MPKYDIDKILEQQNKQIADLQIKPFSQPTPSTPSDKPRSALESAMIGASRGATFGLAPKIIAGLESTRSKFTNEPRSYEDVLQEATGMYRSASEQNPASYLAGEIGAGVAAPIGQAVTGAKLGRLAAMGAGTGALSGLGYSEGQDVGQVAKDVAIGGILGGSLPVLGRGVQSAIQGVKPAIDTSIKSGLSAMTGKTLPYLEKVESQPERIKKIERIFTGTGKEETQKLANDITDLVKKNPFERKAKLLSNQAYKILQKENDNISISKEEILNNLKNIGSTLNPVSEVDQITLGKLNNKIKSIDENFPEVLSGIKSKELIKLIDKDIRSLTPKIGEVRQLGQDAENTLNVYKEIRRQIDIPLKSQSPRYADAMKPTADATNVSEYLKRLTISQFGGKEASAEKAEQFIKDKLRSNALAMSEGESYTLKLMKDELQKPRYNNYQGIEKLRDVNQTISDLKLLQEIQATGTIGSSVNQRMMGGGAAIGSAIAGTPGTIVGTLAGALAAPTMERQGGRFAAKVLERTKGIRTPTAIPEATQRGFQAQQGIQRGLLDQFLTENAGEVRRKREMESKLPENRVRK
jgi:hypothetical protein